MRCALLAFAAGIAGLQTCAALPALAWCVSLAAIAALLALALTWGPAQLPASGAAPHRFHCLRLLRLLLSIACAALAGFVWAAFCAHQHLRDRLPPEWEGRDIELVGTVENLPLASERGRR